MKIHRLVILQRKAYGSVFIEATVFISKIKIKICVCCHSGQQSVKVLVTNKMPLVPYLICIRPAPFKYKTGYYKLATVIRL